MFDPQIVFLRTHAGRTEIHEKKSGLTQSERLVLIMIDGVTPYSRVRAKLPVLTEQRFERAMHTLLQKELISEVFMPVPNEKPEEVERSVIDRYLQQDPLDPVTIIMAPEDERLDLPPRIPQIPAASIDELPSRSPPSNEPIHASRPAINEQDARIADEIGAQARARARPRVAPARIRNIYEPEARQRRPAGRGPIIYWGMAISGAFILGYALARLTS